MPRVDDENGRLLDSCRPMMRREPRELHFSLGDFPCKAAVAVSPTARLGNSETAYFLCAATASLISSVAKSVRFVCDLQQDTPSLIQP